MFKEGFNSCWQSKNNSSNIYPSYTVLSCLKKVYRKCHLGVEFVENKTIENIKNTQTLCLPLIFGMPTKLLQKNILKKLPPYPMCKKNDNQQFFLYVALVRGMLCKITRPWDLCGHKFTSPLLKSLASGMRSSIQIKPCPSWDHITESKAVFEFAATATARFLRHHALRYRTSIETPIATAVATAVASDLA